MAETGPTKLTRRAFVGSTAFMIVPRHVLGAPFVPPSDKLTVASVGMGHQGFEVTMNLLARPDVQVVAVCDVNKSSTNYIDYGKNQTRDAARRLLGAGYENWGEHFESPGEIDMTRESHYHLGVGGREPARQLVEAYYASRKASGQFKGCTAYNDYRELLEKEKDLDAVYVATPDHWHAPISVAAMRKRKNVLCQKPMTRTIGEAHRMAQIAREMKVATALPVNNASSASTRLIREWLRDGAIGQVREVHNWSGRPYWPQGIPRPKEAQPVPEGLDWNLWLGPAPDRPFHSAYLPFVWRGWHDFGCGSFGDMGCYSFAGMFNILDLTPPLAVEAVTSESFDETFPKASIVYLDYPEHNGRPPIRMSWYEGGLKPRRPAGLTKAHQALFVHAEDGEGVMYVGDKGILVGDFSGDNPRVYPESPKYQVPADMPSAYSDHGGAIDQWIAACKGGAPASTNFEVQAPVTEAFLLGCLAQRLPGERFEWDAEKTQVTNSEKANKYIDPPYRAGFTS